MNRNTNNDKNAEAQRSITDQKLLFALDRLALGFESADPHLRHEAKMVAKQNLSRIAAEIEEDHAR